MRVLTSTTGSSQAELPEGSENASGQLSPHCPPLLQELREQSPCMLERDTVRWVLTVPAIWKQPAKQFMREAAYLVRCAGGTEVAHTSPLLQP